MGFGLVVFVVVYQRKIQKQQLERQAEENRHQRALLNAAVEVQESERRRIAGDLHDEIGSLLSAARLYLRQLNPEGPPEDNEKVREETLDILAKIIQNTRRITHDLLPAELEKFGLIAATEDLCERINAGGIQVNFHTATEERLAPRREVAVYRVLQELLNNTLKHAEATQIDVRFEVPSKRQLRLLYADNGKGFDLSSVNTRGSGGGLGLRNIESRISLASGTIDYQSAAGKGTRVEILLPRGKTDENFQSSDSRNGEPPARPEDSSRKGIFVLE